MLFGKIKMYAPSADTMKIIVETNVVAPTDAVWRAFNNPDDIVQWDVCDDWHTTNAVNDLKLNGKLSLRIEAKDGIGFAFTATYTKVEPGRLIEFRMDDDVRPACSGDPQFLTER
jgi:uncharacterized protein YndB with AHSA1/START domain